jgi:lipoprotein-anchoring transpeptidase ErfK/SrfK
LAAVFAFLNGAEFAFTAVVIQDRRENSAPGFSAPRGLAFALFCAIFLTAGAATLAGQTSSSAGESSQRPAAKRATRPPGQKPLTKDEVRAAEQRLADLGYWTGAIDGEFDGASRHALIAFQKVEGHKRTGVLTREEFTALQAAPKPLPRERNYAHVEIDLGRQVLFMVNDKGQATHILPVSSGSGEEFTSEGWTRQAITPAGKFSVFWKLEGWRKSALGLLYYPNYICGGVAIHGSPSVPTTPSSHGCIRIPMFAAKEFSALTPMGTIVVVYNDTPAGSSP